MLSAGGAVCARACHTKAVAVSAQMQYFQRVFNYTKLIAIAIMSKTSKCKLEQNNTNA
jgi:hypothetical protein